jgi:hypothetical protein
MVVPLSHESKTEDLYFVFQNGSRANTVNMNSPCLFSIMLSLMQVICISVLQRSESHLPDATYRQVWDAVVRKCQRKSVVLNQAVAALTVNSE